MYFSVLLLLRLPLLGNRERADLSASLRKHAYSNIVKILPPKNEKFQIKNSDIFHISAHNIDCGYSLGHLLLHIVYIQTAFVFFFFCFFVCFFV